MSDARWSIEKWQSLLRTLFRPEHVAFFPHKVFRWDAEGIYRDCFSHLSADIYLAEKQL